MSTIIRETQLAPLLAPAAPARQRRSSTRPASRGTAGAGVVHLTAEYWPFARTGGLGEAVSGLAREQAARGVATTVVLPLYRQVAHALELEPAGPAIPVTLGTRSDTAQLYRTAQRAGGEDGAPAVYFLEHAEFFDRPGIYGDDADYRDNAQRFGFFCAAALTALPWLAPGAGVLHAHDWHAALAPVYLRTRFAGTRFYDRLAAVLSVHNAGFQGHFSPDTLRALGLPDALYDLQHFEWYGRVNLLKAGLAFSDMAITVSRTHAAELRTEQGGFGLHHTFAGLGDRLVGIRNGIDAQTWDPEHDPCIPATYSRTDFTGKRECKTALQHANGWPDRPRTLLVGMSTRLVEQKGLDLVLGADLFGPTDTQYVILGGGELRYRSALARLALSAPDRLAVQFDFTDAAEHRLLAGADVLLMPSLYEPCGLTQIRAQRYGTVPVARAVGGLADSIADGHNGLLFRDYTPAALEGVLRRTWHAYHDEDAWGQLMRDAMNQRFGWGPAAQEYRDLYKRARKLRPNQPPAREPVRE